MIDLRTKTTAGLIRWGIFGVMIVCGRLVHAQGFMDRFDGTFTGSYEIQSGDGAVEVVDGRLVVTSNTQDSLLVKPVDENGNGFRFQDVSISAVAHASGSAQFGFLKGIFGAVTDTEDEMAIFALDIDSGGELAANNNIPFNIGGQDIQLQFDAFNDELSFSSWPVADPTNRVDLTTLAIPSGSDGEIFIYVRPFNGSSEPVTFDNLVIRPIPHQRSPFFWDEFDRSDLFDTDIPYIRDDTPEEEYEIVDGSLIVNSLADDYPAVRVDVPEGVNDFTIKTQGRILDNSHCQWAWLGMYGRASESQTSGSFDSQTGLYWACYSTQGQIHIGETSAVPDNEIHVQKQEYSCREATENDVHMEFRILGNELEFTTWLDGSPRPEEPNLTWTDTTWTESDFAGVFLNPDHLEDFALRYLAILPAVDGDFDASGVLDATDIDLLSVEVRSGGNNRALDLNGDAIGNEADRLALIHDLLDTWIGDSNLDGEFNSGDFVEVFQSGQYEDAVIGNSTWATGDWNGDAEFDSGDFVVAFQDGGFEEGPRIGVAKVPEPSFRLLGFGLMLLVSNSRVVRNRR